MSEHVENREPTPDSMSRLKMLTECQERYRLEYVERWRPRFSSKSLWFGTMIHQWLEGFYKTMGGIDATEAINKLGTMIEEAERDVGDQGDAEMLREMLAMLAGVTETYPAWSEEHDTDIKVLAVEQEMEFLGVRYRVDLLVEKLTEPNAGIWVMDHKTHSLGTDDRYGEQVHFDLQAQVYVAGCRAKGMVYNLIGKPRIRLKKGETKADFVLRLKQEFADPSKEYFKRLWYPMTELTPEKVQRELHGRRTIYKHLASDVGMAGPWPRNTTACFSYGSRCPFLPLCAGMTNPEDFYDRKDRNDGNSNNPTTGDQSGVGAGASPPNAADRRPWDGEDLVREGLPQRGGKDADPRQ